MNSHFNDLQPFSHSIDLNSPLFFLAVKNQQKKSTQNDFESNREKNTHFVASETTIKFFNKYLFVFSAPFKSATDISQNIFFLHSIASLFHVNVCMKICEVVDYILIYKFSVILHSCKCNFKLKI